MRFSEDCGGIEHSVTPFVVWVLLTRRPTSVRSSFVLFLCFRLSSLSSLSSVLPAVDLRCAVAVISELC